MNKFIAGIIFLLSGACLVITTLMTRQSGISQAATAEGQQLLGWASIAIHLGLPVFGIASGISMRAGNKIVGVVFMVLVALCALFSVNNVLSFVASERMSIAQARDAELKAKAKREEAALEAVKQRQKDVTKLVESQLRWNQGTAKEVDGRRERKDMVEANSKLITDFAKSEIPTVAPSVDNGVTVRPQSGAELVAEFTGWRVNILQFASMIQVVTMMIIFESFGWPLGTYIATAQPLRIEPRELPLPVPPPLPLDGGNNGKTRLLSAPSRQPLDTKTVTVRKEPSAEWRSLLDKVDFPPAGARHAGPERPKDKREHLVPRWLVWLMAYNEAGDFPAEHIDELYDEYATADHRIPWGTGIVKSELEALGKRFASKVVRDGATMWTLQEVPLDRVQALLVKAKVIPVQKGETQVPTTEASAIDEEGSAKRSAGSIIPFLWKSRQAGGGLH